VCDGGTSARVDADACCTRASSAAGWSSHGMYIMMWMWAARDACSCAASWAANRARTDYCGKKGGPLGVAAFTLAGASAMPCQ
jgi:hypothetical protein